MLLIIVLWFGSGVLAALMNVHLVYQYGRTDERYQFSCPEWLLNLMPLLVLSGFLSLHHEWPEFKRWLDSAGRSITWRSFTTRKWIDPGKTMIKHP